MFQVMNCSSLNLELATLDRDLVALLISPMQPFPSGDRVRGKSISDRMSREKSPTLTPALSLRARGPEDKKSPIGKLLL